MVVHEILRCPVSKGQFQAAMKRLPALNVDHGVIAAARASARKIAKAIQAEIVAGKSTTAVERASLTLLGVDGAQELSDHPLEAMPPYVNIVVKNVRDHAKLGRGIVPQFVNAMVTSGRDNVQAFAEKVVAEGLDVSSFPQQDETRVKALMDRVVREGLERLDGQIALRAKNREELGTSPPPLLYLIVATGDIRDDAPQARAVVREGADIVAVIRHSAQSLMDFVPIGQVTGGRGGTYATRANMRYMRNALDDIGADPSVNRYIQLTNYASGLCMPEIAAIGALERLDVLLNDSMYGTIFRDINPRRTFIDQHYSRLICAYAGITINTGEDNYLTTADAVDFAHTVYASNLMNEQLALQTHLPEGLMGLGHAYEIDPKRPDSFLYQLAEALLSRSLFPEAPLKYMPPTKFIKGDIYFAHTLEANFNLVAYLTAQTIHLLGIMSEGSRNPHFAERLDAIRSAKLMRLAHHNETGIFQTHGTIIEQRAQVVLANILSFLEEVEGTGILTALAEGKFAETKRPADKGKGIEGVIEKSPDYQNPIFEELERRLTS